jgi:hypothetical protein
MAESSRARSPLGAMVLVAYAGLESIISSRIRSCSGDRFGTTRAGRADRSRSSDEVLKGVARRNEQFARNGSATDWEDLRIPPAGSSPY